MTKIVDLDKTRKLLLGSKTHRGLIPVSVTYVVLISLGFVYIMPLLTTIIYSIMTTSDMVDPMVVWVPTQIYFGHLRTAWQVMAFTEGLYTSLVMTAGPALVQTISTALAGYAFARYEFPLKRLWLAMLIIIYIIPTQVLIVPRFLLFMNYGLLDIPPWPTYLPAMFGQGIRSSIFILIFYQFFHSYPKSLDEAAEIDGCGRFKLFRLIAIPMVKPAIVISFLFSLVWYWNETTMFTALYARLREISLFGVSVDRIYTLPLRIIRFQARYEHMQREAGILGQHHTILDSVTLSGMLLAILPLLIIYLILQRHFVESVERSGITGE